MTTQRVNHSCAPNVRNALDGDEAVLVATRDLLAGDELLLSYLDEDEMQLTVAERQRSLHLKYRFHCACLRCAREEKEAADAAVASPVPAPSPARAAAATRGTRGSYDTFVEAVEQRARDTTGRCFGSYVPPHVPRS